MTVMTDRDRMKAHLRHMAMVRPAELDRDVVAWALEEIERLELMRDVALKTLKDERATRDS